MPHHPQHFAPVDRPQIEDRREFGLQHLAERVALLNIPRAIARVCGRSPVTRPARGQLGRRLDVIFGHQPAAEHHMICGRLPVEIEDRLARAKVRRRIAVAIEAEVHLERLGATGQRHAVDAPVTFGAADALGDVDAMVGNRRNPAMRATRFQRSGLFSARLWRTGASSAALVHSCEWQVMHTCVGGKPALALISTEVWQ